MVSREWCSKIWSPQQADSGNPLLSLNQWSPTSREQPLRGAIYFGLGIGSSCSDVEGGQLASTGAWLAEFLSDPPPKNQFSFSGAAGCNPGPLIDRWLLYLGASCFDPLAGRRYCNTGVTTVNILSSPNCTSTEGRLSVDRRGLHCTTFL